MFDTLLAAVSPEGGDLVINLTPQMLSIIPLLAVAMQMLKGIEPVAKLKAWFPLLSVVVAVGLAIVMKMGPDTQSQIMAGVVMGLATAGGYDTARMASKVTAPLAPAGTRNTP